MKFSLISDMHINFPQERTPYDKLEENVIVAGDTSNGLEGLKFLQKLKKKGFTVFAVDGNHEHYSNVRQGRPAKETVARFREDHRRYHDLPVPVVLANGWYHVSDHDAWYGYMNDGRMSGLSGSDVVALALEDASHVKTYLQEWKDTQRQGIVVTHTAPCIETLDPRFEGAPSNEWYWSPYMRELLPKYSDQILVWCHGHTHYSNEAVVDGVRVVCNPRGYPGENPGWSPVTINVGE